LEETSSISIKANHAGIRTDLFEQGSDSQCYPLRPHLGKKPHTLLNLHEEVARLASVKLSDGDVHGAVSMLASVVCCAKYSGLDVFRSKHPAEPPDRRPVPQLTAPPLQCWLVQVLSVLHSFRLGSSSGQDGLPPQHVQDMFQAASLTLGPLLVDFPNMVR